MSALALPRHSLVLAKRNLIGVMRNPEALLDVTLQPVIFIAMFTYIFGGAIANGSQHDYLQFLLPGVLAQMVAFGAVAIGVNLNSDIEKGVFDRFRSLPIARAAPLVGAVLADIVRYTLLCVVTLGFGYALGFRATTSLYEVLAACGIVDRVRALPELGVGVHRHDRPHAGRRAGDRLPDHVPADVRRRARSSRSTRCRAGCRRSPSTTRSRT